MDISKLNQIDKALREYPAEIARCAEVENDARFLLDTEKLKLKALEAKKHLEHKASGVDLTQSDLKAKVEADDEVYAQRMAVIEFESEFRKCGIKTERYLNGFNAARKSANLEIAMAQTVYDTVRGGTKEER